MKRIYLDWGVISNLKKEEFSSLKELFLSHKDVFFFVYSPAHIDDLMRSEDGERSEIDLKMLSDLAGDHLLAFDKTTAHPYKVNPVQYFADRKKEGSINLGNLHEILSPLEESSVFKNSGFVERLADLWSIPVPLPESMRNNDLFCKMLPGLPANPSLMDIVEAMGIFMEKMQRDTQYYKSYRSSIHDNGIKLDKNSGNWDEEQALNGISSYLRLIGIDKSFRDFVLDSFTNKDKITDYELFVAAYTILDLIGYHSDKFKKGNAMNSVITDAQHAYFAAFCDCLVTLDKRLAKKAKALYYEFKIPTIVLSPAEAEVELRMEVDSLTGFNLMRFVENELTKENIVSVHDKDDQHKGPSIVYKMNHPLMGIFTHCVVGQPRGKNDLIMQFKMLYDNLSCFTYYDEIGMIIDTVANYFGKDGFTEYEETRKKMIRGDDSVSLCWTFDKGFIQIKNDPERNRPELILVFNMPLRDSGSNPE